MNTANVQIEIEAADVELSEGDISALSSEQLFMIAGGECVVNSI